MANEILTDRAIKNAKPRDKEYLLADGSGLFLRIRPDDSKSWLMIYTFGGKRRKLGLGSLATMSLKLARERAQQARDEVSQQTDPQLAKQEREADQERQRQALVARITVFDLFERWAAVDLIRRKDKGAEVRRMFEKDVLPTIGHFAVEDIKKGHITAIADELLARGVTRMAKVIFSLIRQMFRFAVDRDIVEADPTASIRKTKIGGKDTERDRVLSEDEIKELGNKLPEAQLLPTTECAVWLALSTCCRIGELLQARWEHLDFGKSTWLIPAENAKNKQAHTIQLSEFALNQFKHLQQFHGAGQWCYPNRDSTKSVCTKTITKQLGDRQRVSAPMSGRSKATATLKLSGEKWTPHDLRRTGATIMVSLGVLPEVAERCLNHTEENKVKRIYQRHSYENEMRHAWRLLGERLELLTSGAKNVVAAEFVKVA